MQFLIDFYNSASDSAITSYLQNNGCTVLKQWNNYDKVFLVESSSIPPSDPLIERIIEENPLKIKPLDVLNINPYVMTHADPNEPSITVTVNDDKDWWKNYSYIQPVFDQPSMTISRLGRGITVYLMDSGIQTSHPEFSEANIVNLYTVTPNDYNDYRGHGTALASVIVGKTCGITSATLKNVKIYDQNHQTLQSEFLDALDAIITDHVDNTFSVLNCSWIIEKNEWVEHKLRILQDEGVFVIAAAGNQGTTIEDVTPASMLEVITVGAYNQQLTPCDFSNYTGTESSISVTAGSTNHGELDGWAPGENIYTATIDGSYGYCSGTSIATAISSAILASNLHYFANPDGTRSLHYENLNISTAVFGSNSWLFARPGVLELTDPKYSNSSQVMATLKDISALSAVQSPDEFRVSIRVGESKPVVRLYHPRYTKSISGIENLPDNFTLLTEGLLYGSPVEAQGPTNGQPYNIQNFEIVRTNLDDTQETIKVKLYILPENFDPASVPQDDEVVTILLQSGCFNLPGVPTCSAGFAQDCTDTCTAGTTCCNPAGKYDFECQCQG